MPALSLDHWNIYCKDLDATVRFYERYVGLTNGDRPPFMFPGAWMYAGDKAILHIVSETDRKDHGSGAIDHIAFECEGIDGIKARLEAMKLEFVENAFPSAGLRQLFVQDPNGVTLELNFR